MSEIEQFIIDYIQREYTIDDSINILELNYVESGYIDSMGLIQFIATIEDEFQIEFSDDDLDNPDIKVVGKLAKMIEKKMGN